jgi:hypothetical protein
MITVERFEVLEGLKLCLIFHHPTPFLIPYNDDFTTCEKIIKLVFWFPPSKYLESLYGFHDLIVRNDSCDV